VVRCRCAVVALATGLVGAACDSTRPLPPAVFVQPTTLKLQDGDTAKLTAKLRNPKSRIVRWSSSNPAVATVDLTGLVTAVVNGTTDVIVRMTDDTTISATVPVTVIGPPVATISLNPASATVYVGTGRQIVAQLRAADGRVLRGRTVTWTTPDASIADVSAAGVVRGRAPGGPISLGAASEGHTATAQVRVAYAAEICPFIAPLAIGQRADGRLALGDCEFSLDDSYVDVYEITLPTAATIQIDMTSGDLDSYLGLFDGTGLFLAEDDNSGGGRNSQIVRQLAAGKYRIWANTIAAGTTGAYSLIVTQR
jgi:Big-like domain-containing protein/pre-peptidase